VGVLRVLQTSMSELDRIRELCSGPVNGRPFGLNWNQLRLLSSAQTRAKELDTALQDFPELASAEEREEWHYSSSHIHRADEVIPTMPDWWNISARSNRLEMAPEASTRTAFEARPAALGLTAAEIDSLEAHSENPLLLPVQKRMCFNELREEVLRQLISASECGSVADLCRVLRDELDSGIPSPVPDWYVFPATSTGLRNIGYDCCAARGCLKTESVDSKFPKCSKCKVVRCPHPPGPLATVCVFAVASACLVERAPRVLFRFVVSGKPHADFWAFSILWCHN
jgi:hypothetical protein